MPVQLDVVNIATKVKYKVMTCCVTEWHNLLSEALLEDRVVGSSDFGRAAKRQRFVRNGQLGEMIR